MKVKKRNGRIQEFDINKIKITLEKASDEVDRPLNSSDINHIASDIQRSIMAMGGDSICVCDIQSIVIKELNSNKFKDIAHHYENYNKSGDCKCK